MSDFPELDARAKTCDHDTKLAIVCMVFEALVKNSKQGGSFRNLIYGHLGLCQGDYVPLLEAGGQEIVNELYEKFR